MRGRVGEGEAYFAVAGSGADATGILSVVVVVGVRIGIIHPIEIEIEAAELGRIAGAEIGLDACAAIVIDVRAPRENVEAAFMQNGQLRLERRALVGEGVAAKPVVGHRHECQVDFERVPIRSGRFLGFGANRQRKGGHAGEEPFGWSHGPRHSGVPRIELRRRAVKLGPWRQYLLL